ncbi:MAG: UDP-3-O-(3-hydroxymyristoyl)glucosamine N-acyltransferase [Planctomycetota bacterium]
MVTLSDIAQTLGQPLPADADPLRVITAPAPLESAGPDEIALVGHPKFAAAFATTAAGVVIAPTGLDLPERESPPIVFRVDDADAGFIDLLERFAEPRPTGVHPTAVVHETATLGADCYVGPHCYVGPRCILGDRVTLQANVVVGSDGFGFHWTGTAHRRVPHLGHVEIGDDVEIGACTCVDSGKFPGSPTVIGPGTKIDNLVQVGHNCRVGQHCILVSRVGLAGSVTVGDGVIIAADVSVRDHLTVGDGAIIAARSGVTKDVPPGARVGGMPAVEQRQFLRTLRILEELPDLARDVKALKKQAAEEQRAMGNEC